jgi:hypothetical protein
LGEGETTPCFFAFAGFPAVGLAANDDAFGAFSPSVGARSTMLRFCDVSFAVSLGRLPAI